MNDTDEEPTEDEVERLREADPDSPALGVLDDDDDQDPPEPNEPG